MDSADVVFSGVVRFYYEPPSTYWLPAPLDELARQLLGDTPRAKFEVREAWKGIEARTVTIYSADSSCGDGMRGLESGMEMLVFAVRSDDGELWADVCHRPILLDCEAARETLVLLGAGRRYMSSALLLMTIASSLLALTLVSLPFVWRWWQRRRLQALASDDPQS